MCFKGKKYRVKSGGRFTMFVAFAIVMIVMVSNTLLGSNNAASLTERQYIEVTVEYGDTLWDMAGTYMTGKDIRRAVHTLGLINDTSAGELMAGQVIWIPIE